MKSERNLVWKYTHGEEYIECYENVVTLGNGKKLAPEYEVKAMLGEWLREWSFENLMEAWQKGIQPLVDGEWTKVI